MAGLSDFRRAIMPPWLLGPSGRNWADAHGASEDDLVALTKEAVTAPWPSLGPVDALPLMGEDAQFERGPTESEEAFRARLLAAFDAWAWAGTKKGLLQYALGPAGFPNAGVIVSDLSSDLALFEADGTRHAIGGVPPDGDLSKWARFWVVIAEPHPWTRRAWDSGWDYDVPSGSTWDSDALVGEVARVERLVKQWSPGHAKAMGVFVVFGSSLVPDAIPGAPWLEASLTFGGSPCMFWRFT